MNITTDDIAILRIIQKKELIALDKAISAALPEASSMARSRKEKDLILSGLVEQPEDIDHFKPQYWLSDEGKKIVKEYEIHEGLDKISNEIHSRKRNWTGNIFSFKEICQEID